MQKHTKVYCDYFGIGEQDVPECEICTNRLRDVHHVYPKGMGGRKTFEHKGKTYDINDIKNLMGLCRRDHDLAHENKHSKSFLWFTHAQVMEKEL